MADLTTFTLAIKSTIDKLATGLATAEGLPFVDMDDLVAKQDLFASEDPALIWEFASLLPAPRDPMYLLQFFMGMKSSRDASGYATMKLLGEISNLLPERQVVDVFDYSADTGGGIGVKLGYFMPITIDVTPQEYDKLTGVRTVTVVARAFRDPTI